MTNNNINLVLGPNLELENRNFSTVLFFVKKFFNPLKINDVLTKVNNTPRQRGGVARSHFNDLVSLWFV